MKRATEPNTQARHVDSIYFVWPATWFVEPPRSLNPPARHRVTASSPSAPAREALALAHFGHLLLAFGELISAILPRCRHHTPSGRPERADSPAGATCRPLSLVHHGPPRDGPCEQLARFVDQGEQPRMRARFVDQGEQPDPPGRAALARGDPTRAVGSLGASGG